MQTSNVSHIWRPRAGTSPSPSPERFRRSTYTAEQELFLHRFENLLDKRRQHSGRLSPSDWRRRLIDKALFSTYQDCLDLDLADEARETLRQGQGSTSK